MLKRLISFMTLGSICCVPQLMAENIITWETLGNNVDTEGQYYTQRFTVDADGPFERLAFCMFKRPMSTVNPADTLIELLPGYFAIGSERFKEAKAGEPIVIDVRTQGVLKNDSYKSDGMHLVARGKAVPAKNILKGATAFPAQYITHSDKGNYDPMVYGDEAFVVNDSLRSSHRTDAYGGIPTWKSVRLTGGNVSVPDPIKARIVKIEDPRHDYFRAIIDGDGLTLYTNSTAPQAVIDMVMQRVYRTADTAGSWSTGSQPVSVYAPPYVPAAVIEDWADLPYRGLMLDIARNYIPVDAVKRMVDLMADYGLNVLHLHLGEDEAWRLEIPALPELTQVGSRRGYCTDDNQPFLKGIYSGDGSPDSGAPANGYITMAEYIDLLKYAAERGVDVVPEFDTPGHSRAAIRAMEYRARKTGDRRLRLIEDGDTSVYTSAQSFHDNIMNPALEGPYLFWDIVMGAMVDAYRQAGVPLRAIHIGGDEVAKHGWDGSPAVQELMKREGLKSQGDVHAYFVERVADIAAKHGVKIMGWQEIALDHSPEYDATVQPVVSGVNCWTNAGKYGAQMAEHGYPLILSNVNYLYFDQTPTSHPEEPGLTWGGIVDEFASLHATVDELCPGTPEVQANVAGISCHLFAETVRSPQMVERYFLPRLLGMAERGHNAKPTISDTEYFGYLTQEMDRWAQDGRNFYMRQPGIRVNADGMVEMNEPYGKGEIRYTLDGTEPTADSELYTAPFAADDNRQVRARLYYGPATSVTSILYLDDTLNNTK